MNLFSHSPVFSGGFFSCRPAGNPVVCRGQYERENQAGILAGIEQGMAVSEIFSRFEECRFVAFLFVIFNKPPHLIIRFLLVLYSRKKNADTVNVVFDVHRLVIHDQQDLPLRAKGVFFMFPPHIAFPLFLCRCSVFVVVSEDPHCYSPVTTVVSVTLNIWEGGVRGEDNVTDGSDGDYPAAMKKVKSLFCQGDIPQVTHVPAVRGNWL